MTIIELVMQIMNLDKINAIQLLDQYRISVEKSKYC